tara:strand:+ start:1396 stop:1566 length:171 start_codon:yes stop_codon:yes gene_type:complete
MSIDNDKQDANRWRYLCDAQILPIEVTMLLSLGAKRELLNTVIDKAMLGNTNETLN